jgi:branched-chain amino acid transport system ATP-binding protein
MLSVRGLEAHYGRARVLNGISFEIGAGSTWVLLGRNGAGKSTLLKSLIGLVRPSAGSIRFAGQDIARQPPCRIARLGVGYVPEERRVFSELTVLENLEVGRRPPAQGLVAWTPERLFALFPGLSGLRHRAAGRMSGGEQQMLTIARTLMGNPRLLLLDEPSEGLAPIVLEALAASLATLSGQGLTLLLAEQNLRVASLLAREALVMERGTVVWRGPLASLQADMRLLSDHLGA